MLGSLCYKFMMSRSHRSTRTMMRLGTSCDPIRPLSRSTEIARTSSQQKNEVSARPFIW